MHIYYLWVNLIILFVIFPSSQRQKLYIILDLERLKLFSISISIFLGGLGTLLFCKIFKLFHHRVFSGNDCLELPVKIDWLESSHFFRISTSKSRKTWYDYDYLEFLVGAVLLEDFVNEFLTDFVLYFSLVFLPFEIALVIKSAWHEVLVFNVDKVLCFLYKFNIRQIYWLFRMSILIPHSPIRCGS